MIITAAFQPGQTAVTTAALWQYDYGQILQISGLSGINAGTEVHFAPCSHPKFAYVVTGNYDSRTNTLTVEIPAAFTEFYDGSTARAWVYVADADSGTTIRQINVPITPRTRPQGYLSTTDPEGSGAAAVAVWAAQEIGAAMQGYDTLKDAVTDQGLYHYETTEDYTQIPLTHINDNDGFYMALRNGVISRTAAANAYYTDYIAVSPGDKLKISTRYGFNAPLIVCYDDNKTALLSQTEPFTGDSGTTASDLLITVPEGVSYITVNTIQAAAYPITVKTQVFTVIKIEDKVRAMSEQMNNSKLNGKTLYIDGDSIMFGYNYDGTGDYETGYSVGEYLQDTHSMILTKAAVSGSTLAQIEGSNNSIYARMSALSNDYDYIIFDGGLNDNAQSVPVGTVTDSFNSDFDVTTTVGALEAICKHLVQNFPNTEKLFIITHEVTTPSLNRNTVYLSRMAECIKALEKWGIPVLNMTDTQLKIVDGDSQQFYFHSDDRIHPNAVGYMFYGKKAEKYLLYGLNDTVTSTDVYLKSQLTEKNLVISDNGTTTTYKILVVN